MGSGNHAHKLEHLQLNLASSIVLTLVLLRVINSIFVYSFFSPDEYWQSLEIGHKITFGYGHETWEWRQQWKLRNYIYPYFIAGIYQILKITHMDTVLSVIIFPKMIHGLLLSTTDILIYFCTSNWFGVKPAQYALITSLGSWFLFLF